MRCPSGRPARVLPGALPCGVRTFLGRTRRLSRDRPAHSPLGIIPASGARATRGEQAHVSLARAEWYPDLSHEEGHREREIVNLFGRRLAARVPQARVVLQRDRAA